MADVGSGGIYLLEDTSKGIPLWPSSRFTRYTQGHPIMAMRPFYKVYEEEDK